MKAFRELTLNTPGGVRTGFSHVVILDFVLLLSTWKIDAFYRLAA